jgi:5-methyltetrahydrofolate--homocysteine methyltransferase
MPDTIPLADEPTLLARAIEAVQSVTDAPLAIDSSIVEALEAGLRAYRGKPLLNSVTGEELRLERVLPLVKRYGCAVVAISNDDSGISDDPDVRFAVARKSHREAPAETGGRRCRRAGQGRSARAGAAQS